MSLSHSMVQYYFFSFNFIFRGKIHDTWMFFMFNKFVKLLAERGLHGKSSLHNSASFCQISLSFEHMHKKVLFNIGRYFIENVGFLNDVLPFSCHKVTRTLSHSSTPSILRWAHLFIFYLTAARNRATDRLYIPVRLEEFCYHIPYTCIIKNYQKG